MDLHTIYLESINNNNGSKTKKGTAKNMDFVYRSFTFFNKHTKYAPTVYYEWTKRI